MTTVLVDVRTPGATGPAAAAGRMEWKPTKRRDAQGYVVLPAPFSVELTEGQTSIEVAPSGPDWAWKVTEYINGGITRTVSVPDVVSINYVQLVTVDPLTLLPTAAPSPIWYAYTDGLALSAEQARAAADAAAAAAGTARDGAAGHETAAAGYATAAAGSAAAASADADAADLAADQTGADAAAAKQAAQAADGSAIAADGSATAAAGSAAAAAGSASDAQGFAEGFSAGTATKLLPGAQPTLAISGPIGDRVLDLGIPEGQQGGKGDKGDPGGIVATALAQDVDLNTVVIAGHYRNGQAGLLSMNYPVNELGTLMVYESSSTGWRTQEFSPTENHAARAMSFYRRVQIAGTWGPWRTFAAQRVDNTAGRAIYTYDNTQKREQLTYGDTGWREIAAAELINGWTYGPGGGSLRIRRNDNKVSLSMRHLVAPAAGTSGFFWAGLPNGFRPMFNQRSFIDSAGTIYGIVVRWYERDISCPVAAGKIGDQYTAFEMTWTTTDTWPTTLPGTATGSIPN